ncbi:hypothetical protein R9X47_00310 [Wukongibacter baidiensis]|uniref:hypothetical protein n=1 Tax=Wukongibacter baidiensis TaxID=1723361 RepID=UPI003D7F66B2
MIIAFLIFFTFVGCFEYWKYRKRQAREEAAVFLNIEGKITESKIINKPYYSGIGRGHTTVNSYFMLIFIIENENRGKYQVKVTDSCKYENIDSDEYWSNERWIGTEIRWKVKKYPEADIYVFEESIHQVSREEKIFWQDVMDKRRSNAD